MPPEPSTEILARSEPIERHLGDLEALPAEVRLQIYENLLSSGSPAIMGASKFIMSEIHGRLYDTIQVHLHSSYDYPFMKVSCQRMRLDWTFEHLNDAVMSKVWDMPWEEANIKLEVNIHVPQANDEAGLILLWQKAGDLCRILERTVGAKHIDVVFRHHANERQASLPDPATIQTLPALSSSYGLEALLVPFYRLPQVEVRSTNLAAYNAAGHHTHGFRFDALFTDIDFYFDQAMDSLSGRTAATLRLERFAIWENACCTSVESNFQRLLFATIRKHPATISRHDPALAKFRLRYCAFEVAFDLAHNHCVQPPGCQLWDAWRMEHPVGIPPLSMDWIEQERNKYVEDGNGGDELTPIGPTCFWAKVEEYCRRNWGVAKVSHDYYRVINEGFWCRECRRLGFTDMCRRCKSLKSLDNWDPDHERDDEDEESEYEQLAREYGADYRGDIPDWNPAWEL